MRRNWLKKKGEEIVIDNKNTIQIVYFSGTGGAARVAAGYEKAFLEKGFHVILVPLDMQAEGNQQIPTLEENVGLLLMIYAVHAFGAPEPIYDWISGLPQISGIPAVVISVSGGGEIWPNTASRATCIQSLKEKGFYTFYERMMVMPSNIFMETKEPMAIQLLKILPVKIEHSVNEILSGVYRRRKKPFGFKLILNISNYERKNSSIFGKNLKVNEKCTGCGWCERNCPRKNIKIVDRKPIFDVKCIICLRCIYGCPRNAIYSKYDDKLLVQGEYNLHTLEAKMKVAEDIPVKNIKAGLLYIAVKKYLNNISF